MNNRRAAKLLQSWLDAPDSSEGEIMNCGFCKYWKHVEQNVPMVNGPRVGHCYRNPPSTMMLGSVNPMTRQQEMQQIGLRPPVAESDWCGEYTEKPGAVNG